MTKLTISDLQFCRYIKGLRYLIQTRLLTYKSSIQTCTSSSPSSIPISIVIAFEMEKLLNSKLNSSGKLTRHCLLFVYLFLLPLWTDKRAFIASCGQKKVLCCTSHDRCSARSLVWQLFTIFLHSYASCSTHFVHIKLIETHRIAY